MSRPWKVTKSNVGRLLQGALIDRHHYIPSPRGTVRGGYGRWVSGYTLDIAEDGILVDWIVSRPSDTEKERESIEYNLQRCETVLSKKFEVTRTPAKMGFRLHVRQQGQKPSTTVDSAVDLVTADGMRIRNKQCKACPWKRSTVPDRDIPGGYSAELHRDLQCTIANEGDLRRTPGMACHESPRPGGEYPCVGWLLHQLGPGNNIRLRMLARDGRFSGLQTFGPQHERFEDTLPRSEESWD